MAHSIFLCVLLYTALIQASFVDGRYIHKEVEIDVKSTWPGTSYVHEAAEFLADHSSELFWKFVEEGVLENSRSNESSQAVCWHWLEGELGNHLTDDVLQLLSISLASRQYSPRLEVFRQLSDGLNSSECCWVVLNGRVVESADSLSEVLEQEMQEKGLPGDEKLFDFDHIHPNGSKGKDSLVASLYAPLDAPCAKPLHTAMLKLLESHPTQIAYVWRPITSSKCPHKCTAFGTENDVKIPGYGVELAIKNMEYNARDDASEKEASQEKQQEAVEFASDTSGFDFNKLMQRYPDQKTELKAFGTHLVQASLSRKRTLKVWDLKDIGLQATQKIISAKDSLLTLRDVAQNFPNLVEALSQLEVSKRVREEVDSLGERVASNVELLLVNGISIETWDLNWHSLLTLIRRELQLVHAVQEAGMPREKLTKLLELRAERKQANQDDFRINFKPDDHVIWVNDIENDRRYRSLPLELSHLLQPAFFGQMPAVRRNVLTALIVVNMGTRGGISGFAAISRIVNQGLPVRVGLVPIVSGEENSSKELSMIFLAMVKSFGVRTALAIFEDAEANLPEGAWEDAAVFTDEIHRAIRESMGLRWKELSKKCKEKSMAEYLAHATDTSSEIGKETVGVLNHCMEKATVAGLSKVPEVGGFLLLNGVLHEVPSKSMWNPIIINAWQNEMSVLQELVYNDELKDSSSDLLGVIMKVKGALAAYNPRILSKESLIGQNPSERDGKYDVLISDAIKGLRLSYVLPAHSDDSSPPQLITHLIVINPRTKPGLQLMANALGYNSKASRIGLMLNFMEPDCSLGHMKPIELLIFGLSIGEVQLRSRSDLMRLALALVDLDEPSQLSAKDLWGQSVSPTGLFTSLEEFEANLVSVKTFASKFGELHCRFVRKDLFLEAGKSAVVTNGQVLVNRFMNDISPGDFELLDYDARINRFSNDDLLEFLRSFGVKNGDLSDTAAIFSSILVSHRPEQQAQGKNANVLRLMELKKGSPLVISANSSSSMSPGMVALKVHAILNPLSKNAQMITPILHFLKENFIVEIQVLLNPRVDYSDLPLKTFYRYVLPSFGLQQEGQKLLLPGIPKAQFLSLPLHDVLTLGMDVPEMWLVRPVHAKYDLDNLRLGGLPAAERKVSAAFELTSILVTGMCVDMNGLESGQQGRVHPRGVQLNLGPKHDPAKFDTLVMSNYGYFQLKATAGIWALSLAAGKSSEIYGIESVLGQGKYSSITTAGSVTDSSVHTPVASFSGEQLLLLLRPHKGHSGEDVLDVEGTMTQRYEDDDRIHIFTVASGHMYERLQKIMILSALKRSSMKMKFWFIDNYMSPQMRQFVPHMAKIYDFEYEFVTYKWPSWLHKQTEKQRIIWAYKILFLDVLFPLGLRKVIFCDSDQVIRADLKELWNLDLQGAPYAYTPFCDNNREMDGFRFWKQGFWKKHLHGKPYHISALYVIDLDRFRQMAAGDTLRILYDNLSKDPNSLSNLDQDLPNFAQDRVPIASLPQEWLWCETWCGSATRKVAKTIDLCNNPLTKEPKLQSAKRIIKEWPDLNREAEEFTMRVDAVLAGAMTEEELAKESRFIVRLKPMVEGAVGYAGEQITVPSEPDLVSTEASGSDEPKTEKADRSEL